VSSQKPSLNLDIIQSFPVRYFRIFPRRRSCNLKGLAFSLHAHCSSICFCNTTVDTIMVTLELQGVHFILSLSMAVVAGNSVAYDTCIGVNFESIFPQQFSLPIIFVEESRIADPEAPSLTSHLKIFLHAPTKYISCSFSRVIFDFLQRMWIVLSPPTRNEHAKI